MDNKIYAPFTDEQVLKLRAWQNGEITFPLMIGTKLVNVPPRPFNCGGHDGCTRPDKLHSGKLRPRPEGWICPCGLYTQDWCFDFMIKTETPISEPPGKSLAKRVIDLLKIAKDKGFPNFIEYFDPMEVKSWRHDEFKYCAVVCAVMQLWLRQEHKIEVWVQPVLRGKFKGFIYFWLHKGIYNEQTRSEESSYEEQFLDALTMALIILPDGSQQGPDTTDTNA